VGALVCAACTRDEPVRRLVVDEPVELCAPAPHSKSLEEVLGSQWRLEIDAGEHSLPDPQPIPEGNIVRIAEGSPIEPFIDVRDGDDGSPLGDAEPEVAVIQHADLTLRAADDLDVLWVWFLVDSPFGAGGFWMLSLMIEAPAGGDFRGDDPRLIHFGCFGDLPIGPCPNRTFDACDPGGPTTRTRVTLDRGEIVLDVRHVERDPDNGDLPHVMFVAAELRIDDIDLVEHDFFRLLHSAELSAIGDGSYAVVAPEALEAAGLGCGVVLADVGSESPSAFTSDCQLEELESLAIVAIDREVLP
jgi:hypothetical protein